MGRLRVSVAFWNYDRTLPIADGRVRIDGCELCCSVLRPQELFPRAFGTGEFEVAELSFVRYMMACSRGSSLYTALPVFPSRTFRHASIYVRRDRGIRQPKDLKGRTLGLNNYDDTAAVVARGMLRDDYGIEIPDITWCIGDLEAKQAPRVALEVLPLSVRLIRARDGETLDAMLAAGELDGIVSIVPPPCFRSGHPAIVRLFPDWRAAERDWFRHTRHFPIMHVIGIRNTLLASEPWLARSLFDAFCRAKDLAIAELDNLQATKVTLPWAAAELAETRRVLGADFWPYGMAANRSAIERQIRYASEDGLLTRVLTSDELFVQELLST
ncbi:MAG: ABC transporter substrate-binding protein [Acetobacteraceae bacterium]